MPHAPGNKGIEPRWTSSAKIGVGTAISADSNVWFTLSHGIINEVYWPRIDIANIRDFGFIITDGKEFFSEEKRDCIHDYEMIVDGVPAYLVTNTCKEGRYKILKKIICDPKRNVLLQEIQFQALKGNISDYKIFALVSPHLINGGRNNNGLVGNYKGYPILYAYRKLASLAVLANSPFLKMSVGFVGESDGWRDLHQNKDLVNCYTEAFDGNIALTGEIDLTKNNGKFTIALSFGLRLEEAAIQARASLIRGFDAALDEYIQGWRKAEAKDFDLSTVDEEGGRLFRTSCAVLKTHQGKHFTGSVIASLSIPWGFNRSDNDLGGYHLIWPRDQVETAEAFLAVNDLESAKNIALFLMATQELDGHWPQNMWEDGKSYWSKIQLDETALPILLLGHLQRVCYLKRLDVFDMIKRAASYLINQGPITEQDRWEETFGLTPYTLSVVIASFLVAASYLESKGENKEAEYLRDAADFWNSRIEEWLYVKDTPLAKQIGVEGYYIRVNPSCNQISDPKSLNLVIKNRIEEESVYPAWSIVSCDFLAFVRFGLRSPHDPKIISTLKVIDAVLKTNTPRGPVWHRYNHDGYGEKKDGTPFDGTGVGRGWPLLTAERGHYEVAAGNYDEAIHLLRVLTSMAGTGGLFPEQIWDVEDNAERILFKGHSTGAAKPLVWAHAEYLKLLRSISSKKIFSTPPETLERYIKNKSPPKIALWQHRAQFTEMAQGLKLRIQTLFPAVIHYSFDKWKTSFDIKTIPNGFGSEFIDIKVDKECEFTFFWPLSHTWEEKNYTVKVL